jgi:hypothetical protein
MVEDGLLKVNGQRVSLRRWPIASGVWDGLRPPGAPPGH